jgi:hypothetical protein
MSHWFSLWPFLHYNEAKDVVYCDTCIKAFTLKAAVPYEFSLFTLIFYPNKKFFLNLVPYSLNKPAFKFGAIWSLHFQVIESFIGVPELQMVTFDSFVMMIIMIVVMYHYCCPRIICRCRSSSFWPSF